MQPAPQYLSAANCAGQPSAVAPAYVYLASSDSSCKSGQVLRVNGGTVVNG